MFPASRHHLVAEDEQKITQDGECLWEEREQEVTIIYTQMLYKADKCHLQTLGKWVIMFLCSVTKPLKH